jgi:transcriptional regulator with XRE-family HTH domain
MKYIKADQIKGARAMLGWTREELADASGLSHNTIRNLEMGFISPRGKTLDQLCQAIEEAGLEFTEDEGVRRLRPDIKILSGTDSHEAFFDIMLRATKRKDGEIVGVLNSQDMMMQALGLEGSKNYERLNNLLVSARMKCLLSESGEEPLTFPNCEFRMMPKYCNGSTPFFVFDNSYAIIVRPNGEGAFRFVIFKDLCLALGNKAHFDLLWEIASPLYAPVPAKETRGRIRA